MKPKILRRESYLEMIENSVGTKMFRSLFVEQDGERFDALRGGELSCAVFVSSVLTLHGLIDAPHATVRRTVDELKRAGWQPLEESRPGAVVVWKDREYDDGEVHGHIGFVVSADEAVSTSYRSKEVVRHAMNELDGEREVESFWWHPNLDA